MTECMKHAKSLYEKFSHEVSRKTQSDAWETVAENLRKDGIQIHDSKHLKTNVSNWTRRATQLSDAAKQTGVGKQKKMSEFQELCLSFIRAAKGQYYFNSAKSQLALYFASN